MASDRRCFKAISFIGKIIIGSRYYPFILAADALRSSVREQNKLKALITLNGPSFIAHTLFLSFRDQPYGLMYFSDSDKDFLGQALSGHDLTSGPLLYIGTGDPHDPYYRIDQFEFSQLARINPNAHFIRIKSDGPLNEFQYVNSKLANLRSTQGEFHTLIISLHALRGLFRGKAFLKKIHFSSKKKHDRQNPLNFSFMAPNARLILYIDYGGTDYYMGLNFGSDIMRSAGQFFLKRGGKVVAPTRFIFLPSQRFDSMPDVSTPAGYNYFENLALTYLNDIIPVVTKDSRAIKTIDIFPSQGVLGNAEIEEIIRPVKSFLKAYKAWSLE